MIYIAAKRLTEVCDKLWQWLIFRNSSTQKYGGLNAMDNVLQFIVTADEL